MKISYLNRMAYVYSHIRKDNGKCFYIGKGTGNRAFSIDNRNKHWHNVSAKGYDVKILVNNITEDKAYKLERDFISQVGLENLTNYHEGGKGGGDKFEAAKKAALSKESKEKRIATLKEFYSKNPGSWYGKKNPEQAKRMTGRKQSQELIAKRMNAKMANSQRYIETFSGFVGNRTEIKNKFNNVDLYYSLKREKPVIMKDGTKIKIKKI